MMMSGVKFARTPYCGNLKTIEERQYGPSLSSSRKIPTLSTANREGIQK
jgi:hypothetical protein